MKRTYSLGIVLLLFLLSVTVVPAEAARTSLWEVKDIKSWLEGDFSGIGLTSDGTIQPTISTKSTELPARLAWASVPTENGTIVGTSLPSALYHVTDEGYEPLKKTDDLGFTALRKVGDYVFAAATPSGTIYRSRAGEHDFSELSTLPDSYVWSMIPDENNEGLLIGTGSNGNLYHMTLGGGYVKETSIPDDNILSLTRYENDVHIGSDNGSIYRHDGDETTSVYGFKNSEITSLTSDNAYLYAAVNQREGGQQQNNNEDSNSQLARQLKEQSLEDEQGAQPPFHAQQATPSRENGKPGDDPNTRASSTMIQKMRQQARSGRSGLFAGLNGTMVYRMNPPEQMNVIYNDPQEIVHDLESDGENLYVATGGSGRLYKVEQDFTRVAHFKASQKLVLDVRLNENNRVSSITTGEGGALHQREPFQSTNVKYRSQPLDAQLMARWGDLTHLGSGQIEIRTRSGNSAEPNDYWSDWSDWSATGNFEITSPPARFLQFEARFQEREARLKKVDIAFLIPNQRPRIADFSVSSNPIQQQFITSRSTSENRGQPGQNSSSSHSQQQLDPSSIKQRKVSWKVVDPDGDPAQTKLFYQPLGEDKWISFTGEDYVDDDEYVINLKNLADGQYRLKLTATDRRFNDPGVGFATSEIIGPVLVDNTQPDFQDFSLNRERLSFTAVDETSRIMIAQFRINGGRWQTIWPEDKIYDQTTESFEVLVSGDVDSGDLIEVRMLDEGGNQAMRRGSIP